MVVADRAVLSDGHWQLALTLVKEEEVAWITSLACQRVLALSAICLAIGAESTRQSELPLRAIEVTVIFKSWSRGWGGRQSLDVQEITIKAFRAILLVRAFLTVRKAVIAFLL